LSRKQQKSGREHFKAAATAVLLIIVSAAGVAAAAAFAGHDSVSGAVLIKMPEPATLLLAGIGGLVLFPRRVRSE